MSQSSTAGPFDADEEFVAPVVVLRQGASGRRCFGYTADGADVVEAEAEILRDMARRVLDGDSLRSLVMELNERGVRTTSHGGWQTITLRRLLTNPRLVGLRTYRGEVVGRGDWPPILDRDSFNRIRELLADPARDTNPTGSRARKALLTGGLLVCGGLVERDGQQVVCGMPLHSQPSNNGKPGYACKSGPLGGCGRIRVAAEPLEEEVAAQTLARLASPRVRARIEAAAGVRNGAGVEVLDARIVELTDSMAELSNDYYVHKAISRAEFQSTRTRLNAELEKARAARDQVARIREMPDLTPVGLATWWEEHHGDLLTRRKLVATLLDHIVVSPATKRGFTGLDEGRLTWVWR